MKNRLQLLLSLLPVLVWQPTFAESAAASFQLSVDTPTVEVRPQNRGRAPLVLPDLEYQFRIDASCADSATPASLSLGIADTRRSFTSTQISAGELEAVRLRVPARQIAPVVISDFCVVDTETAVSAEPVGLQAPLIIPAALSAQASLLCAGENDHSIHYSSAALDVILQCVDASPAKESSTNP